MHHKMKKTCALTARRYVARLIDINEYWVYYPGETLNDNIGVVKLNEISLNSMHKIWYIQAYVQGFDCESITF